MSTDKPPVAPGQWRAFIGGRIRHYIPAAELGFSIPLCPANPRTEFFRAGGCTHLPKCKRCETELAARGTREESTDAH